jgi:SpoVK/Ycf46/Vps4 family AAA+-type ATPase
MHFVAQEGIHQSMNLVEGMFRFLSLRVKSEILVQMDGISSISAPVEGSTDPIVMVLGATNFPWYLDYKTLTLG